MFLPVLWAIETTVPAALPNDAHIGIILTAECGSKNGRFIVWKQRKFEYIFEDVPGNAVVFDIYY